MIRPDRPTRQVLARFVRRMESPHAILKQWLPSMPDAESILGAELYRDALRTLPENARDVYELRRRIWERLEPDKPACLCREWPDRQRIGLGSATVDLLNEDFETLRDRNPWIHLVRCRVCGQHWHAAVDTVEDDYYFRRLSAQEVGQLETTGAWPIDFDDFQNVWPQQPGERYIFRPPWSDSTARRDPVV